MKRIFFIVLVLFSTSVLYAQKDTVLYKHEIRAAVGDVTFLPEVVNLMNYNLSIAYFYRPVKHFWAGVNFINYFGNRIYYNWSEYNTDGSFKDFSKSKTKYWAVIAPEIRLSCLNKESVILYGALSGGIGWENGYNSKQQKYPKRLPYIHVTCLGLSCNLGKDKNIFLGGEIGFGFKGLFNGHCGYRF